MDKVTNFYSIVGIWSIFYKLRVMNSLKSIRIYIFFIILILSGSYAQALNPIILEGNTIKNSIKASQFEVFEDPSSLLSFEQIQKGNFPFQLSKTDYDYAKNGKSAYWIRFKAIVKTEKKWLIELPNHHTEDAQIYIPENDSYQMYAVGTNYSFEHRPFKVINFVFNLPSQPGEYVVYLRIKSPTGAGFEINFKSVEYLLEYGTREYWFLGIFYGILFFLICYNLILFITNTETLYLSYAFYLVASALMSFSEDNLFFEFIWPNHPDLNRFIFLRADYIFLVLFFLYSAHFLDLFKESKKKFYSLSGFIVAVLIVLEFWPFGASLWVSLIFCIPFAVMYYLALKKVRKDNKALRLFLIGCTLVIASIILVRLRWYGIVPVSIFSVYIFNISVVFETFIFSYAGVERFASLKKEKEKTQEQLILQLEENKQLQTKVNRELEQKVNERTQELQQEKEKLAEANGKLNLLTEELNKANSKLDFENWHLQKDLKEEKKSRILLEKVSYEEFITIFPNDLACFQFLEKCKWEEQFVCLKCKNNRYIAKPEKPFVRRCTRCGYIESVTTHTLFHAVKFPLNKAFYLAYSSVYEKNERTLDELSELLELRRNTCWSFRKKVLERIEAFQKTKGTPLRNWESIILDEE